MGRNPDEPANPPEDDIATVCNDPTHDSLCDCGAQPDRAFEREREMRGEW